MVRPIIAMMPLLFISLNSACAHLSDFLHPHPHEMLSVELLAVALMLGTAGLLIWVGVRQAARRKAPSAKRGAR